ncbi:MAG TPA: neutral zinc metallopeptidase [Thermoanaerobaculia bacterium]|nr:neutral zinc metallopeptidase [Thermoanaerobaculia bacterium]
MKWTRGGRSADLEDQRGGGGGGGRPGMKLGIGGFLLLAVLSLVFKKDLFSLVGAGGMGPVADVSAGAGPAGGAVDDPREEELVEFVSFVLDDAQATWTKILPTVGGEYSRAKLVLFRDGVDSACGYAGSSTGPFYCPGDQKVYVDLGFYQELKDRFGAPGDFAQAYVIAHELGHHVQHLIGIDQAVRQRQAADPRNENAYSVAMELQADCFAGVWGHETAQRGILERGDVEEGLNAAAAIGDDRMQRAAGQRVTPDAFTHGSSEQRVAWFRKGLESGDIKACDTFGAMR